MKDKINKSAINDTKSNQNSRSDELKNLVLSKGV